MGLQIVHQRIAGWHLLRPGLRILIVVIVLGILGVTLAMIAPTHVAAAVSRPKLLYLIKLQVFITEDSGADEPYLLVNGRKVWSGTLDGPGLCGGCTKAPEYVDLYELGPIPFYDNVEVVLKEEDWPDRDDFLGRVFISATESEGGVHEVWFQEDGANYYLTYALATAPASFVCDGEPGVYLYEHADYRGRCSKFVQNIPDVSWFDIGNDAASSVRFVGGYGAVLYEHHQYGGASSNYVADQHNLRNSDVGNDRISSLTIILPGR